MVCALKPVTQLAEVVKLGISIVTSYGTILREKIPSNDDHTTAASIRRASLGNPALISPLLTLIRMQRDDKMDIQWITQENGD